MLNAVYRAIVDMSGLPHRVGALMRDNVASGVAVGRELHSEAVATSARHAFVNGMDGVLWLCVAISAVAAVLMCMLGLIRRLVPRRLLDQRVAYAASVLGGLLDQRRAVLGGYSTSGSKTNG